MTSYPELKNKIILITGANSGIGLAQATAFLQQGALVTGLDQNVAQMQLLGEKFPDFTYAQVDLTNLDELILALNSIEKLDILVNTAGILDDYQSIEQTSFEQWTKVLNTNVSTMFNVTKLVLAKINSDGVIVNTASIAGMVAGGGGIAPGCIDTPMNAKDFENGGLIASQVAKEVPIKRWAGADEVATVTLFLASAGASYLQGTIIPVDGGWLIK